MKKWLVIAVASVGILVGRVSPAQSLFSLEPGLRVGAGITVGQNTNEKQADDGYLDRGVYFAPEFGYGFSFGTEPFVAVGVGVGGKEGVLHTYGLGLRQRIQLGAVEPFVQAGLFWVGEEAGTPLAPALGGGIDVRLPNGRWALGIGGGHYFSEQSEERASLDWYVRAQVAWRFELR